MQLEYNTYSNQNILDICLNTYGSLNLLGKFMQENNLRNPIYNPPNNIIFVYDNTLITNRIVYNLNNTYATNQLTSNVEQMPTAKRLSFRIGTDKPNGNTVQDDLLKSVTILGVFLGGSEVNENISGYAGWTFNATTGTLDFTNLGGVSSIILDIIYNG
jgi:hypothetical protein